jgi:predicted Ser/Thr protein kinase
MGRKSAPSGNGRLRQLGRYRIVREIGRGAMGVVYLATDPVIGRSVALKTLAYPPDLDESGRAERFERFAREAKAAGNLSHPGLVTVYDAGRDEAEGLCYLAMEYVAGRTLKEALAETGGLPADRVLDVVLQLSQALEHAHDRGVVHRDLKPANILLGEDGSVKIADFGVARMERSDLTRDGASVGSPAYMSPEQVRGQPVDRRSDLFSLGVVLYEMLTGRRPFAGPDANSISYQIVHERPAPLGDHVTPAWGRLLSRLLAKRAETRPADARALHGELLALSQSANAAASVAPDPDVEATVAEHGLTPSGPAAVATGGATLFVLRWMKGVRTAAAWGVRASAWGLRQLALQIPRLAGGLARARSGRRAVVVTGGLIAIVVLSGSFMLLLGAGCRVEVDMKHGLEAGRLWIEVDGREVIDRRFQGEEKSTRMFGKDMFKRSGGEFQDAFVVGPGDHEILVRVKALDGSGDWSRSFSRSLARDENARLKIRVATAFSKGLQLDWAAFGRYSVD